MENEHKVLVIDSGEMTAIIFQALNDLGISFAIACFDIDDDPPYAKFVEEKVCVGPKKDNPVFNIISAASATKADTICVGDAQLAENSEFIEICKAHDLILICPSPDADSIKKQIVSVLNLKASPEELKKLQKEGEINAR